MSKIQTDYDKSAADYADMDLQLPFLWYIYGITTSQRADLRVGQQRLLRGRENNL